MSIATTFVPEMARSVTRGDRAAFCDQASLGVRLVALLTLPAGVLLFVLRRAIVGALLQHGEYTAANADNAARALGGFALGLVGFSLYLFVLRGFYAHQDTRTPFVINVVQNVLNIVLAFALVGRLRHPRAGRRAGHLLRRVRAVGAAGDVVQGARASRCGRSWPACGGWSSPAAIAGEATWLVASRVGDDAGLAGRASGSSSAAVVGRSVYVGVLVALRAPELTALRPRLPGRHRSTVL